MVTTSRAETVAVRRAAPDYASQSVTPVLALPAFSVESLRLVVVRALRGGECAEEPSREGRRCGVACEQSDMNTDVTIVILCGNCTMRTKYPSESIDMWRSGRGDT